jgi:TolA-binding protein
MSVARDKALLVDALTADDRLDDVSLARMWARIDGRVNGGAVRRRWWIPAVAGLAACATVAALFITRSSGDEHVLNAPDDATLETHLGPHARAALVGPARLRVVGLPGDVTTVSLEQGMLLTDFTGGPGRAFHVDAPGMHVDVVGTLFAVDVETSRTCVSVAHGRVHVTVGAREHLVATGQTLCTSDAAPGAITPRVEQALERHEAIIADRVVPPPPSSLPPAPGRAPLHAPAAVVDTPPSSAPPTPDRIRAPSPAPAKVVDTPPPPRVAPPRIAHVRTAATPVRDQTVVATAPVREDAVVASPAPPAGDPGPPPAARTPASPPPSPAPAPPPPPSPDDLYRTAEAALAHHDASTADRVLAQLIATAPTSALVAQATYDRARIAYQRHAWADARHLLAALASLNDRSLAEPGHYLSCRTALESHDADAAHCFRVFRARYPTSAHDRDVLGTLAQLAYADEGCAGAAPYLADLTSRYPQSALAAAWRGTCRESE